MKTAAELSVELTEAYSALATATGCQTQADLSLFRAEQELNVKRDKCLLESEPKALGTNEEQRRAKLNFLCGEELDVLHSAARYRMTIRGVVEAAQLRVDELRCYLRLLEIEAGIHRRA